MSVQDDSDERLSTLLHASSDTAASVTEAGLALLFGGPIGVVAGAVGASTVRAVLRQGGDEFLQRQLSKWQVDRVGRTLLLASERIAEKLSQGYALRTDDFFLREFGKRSIADEILEGVLLAAQIEHEERKIPYLANLLANIMHEDRVDRTTANLLIRTSQELSYTQYALLALLGQPAQPALRDQELAWSELHDQVAPAALEMMDLRNRHMLALRKDDATVEVPGDYSGINPSRMVTIGLGADLYQLMGLWRLDYADQEELVSALA